MTPHAELLHATLAYLTDTLEREDHPSAPLARSVLTAAGPPAQAGVHALIGKQIELNYLADMFDA
jgi:hypothetical protein